MDDFVNEGKMNSGIAIVTPIQEVTKVIMENDLLKKTRAAIERALEQGDGFVEDAAFSGTEPKQFTQADFERDLRKVSRKIAPEK